MRSWNWMKTEEANEASREALRGAIGGAIKWGLGAAILGVIGYSAYPLYRGLTIQFKVYLQSSAMVMGGMLDADSRLRAYENKIRYQRRRMREQAKWERYEQEFLEGKDGK